MRTLFHIRCEKKKKFLFYSHAPPPPSCSQPARNDKRTMPGTMDPIMKKYFDMDMEKWAKGKGPGTCTICLKFFGKVTAVTARSHVAGAVGWGITTCDGPTSPKKKSRSLVLSS